MYNYILAQGGDESSSICSSSQEPADKKIQLIHTLFHLSIIKFSTPTGGRIEREGPLCSAKSVAWIIHRSQACMTAYSVPKKFFNPSLSDACPRGARSGVIQCFTARATRLALISHVKGHARISRRADGSLMELPSVFPSCYFLKNCLVGFSRTDPTSKTVAYNLL